MTTTTLPLFPTLAPLPARVDEPTTEHIELDRRQILRRVQDARTGTVWALDPYRGCEAACIHCPNRRGHHAFQLLRWRDFETKIFVETGAPKALERHLLWQEFAGETLSLGHFADPYQEAEERFRLTRSLLEVMTKFRGLDLSIATRSPRIVADLDLLMELDLRHTVTVHMGIATTDARLSRELEPGGADPADRFAAIERLTEAGIATDLRCIPLMPGINHEAEQLAPLFEAARDAGAFDIVGHCLELPMATRPRFMAWIEERKPRLISRYRRLYGRRSSLRRPDKNRLLSDFRRLYLEMGYPRPTISRG
ncbi:MAG: radical SAM protein [Acidobacteriota bacterium]